MSLRTDDLKTRLTRFLNRRQIPKRIDGKDSAIADEIKALMFVLERSSPRDPDAIAGWWPGYENALGEIAPTYWPNEKEIREASKAIVGTGLKPQGSDWKPDPLGWTAKAMNAGQAVGEHWLWGVSACELIATGLVSRETMTAYRSAAFFNRKSVNGEEAALAWEKDRRAAHDAAREAFKHRDEPSQKRRAEIPDMSAPYREYVE